MTKKDSNHFEYTLPYLLKWSNYSVDMLETNISFTMKQKASSIDFQNNMQHLVFNNGKEITENDGNLQPDRKRTLEISMTLTDGRLFEISNNYNNDNVLKKELTDNFEYVIFLQYCECLCFNKISFIGHNKDHGQIIEIQKW